MKTNIKTLNLPADPETGRKIANIMYRKLTGFLNNLRAGTDMLSGGAVQGYGFDVQENTFVFYIESDSRPNADAAHWLLKEVLSAYIDGVLDGLRMNALDVLKDSK